MPTKTYTAQELRSKASEIVDQLGGNSVTAAMLRYAAEVVERCEELLQKLRPYRDEDIIDTINYILRGDEGKEEK